MTNMIEPKRNEEFEKFTKVMDGLMAVPYKELQEKLREHKERRRKRKFGARRRRRKS